jgi:O-antigen/teichoic acid export membrane protein
MYGLGSYDQIVINQTLGPAETGRYGFAYRWGMAMVAITAAFGALWTPRFLELMREPSGRARLNGLAQRGFVGLAAAAVSLMVVLPILAVPFTPPAFESALALIPVVTYGYLWYALYTMVVAYAMHEKRTARIARGSVTVVGASIALDYVLVPQIGIEAAAFISASAYAALFAVQWWSVREVAVDVRFGRLALVVGVLGVVPIFLWAIR